MKNKMSVLIMVIFFLAVANVAFGADPSRPPTRNLHDPPSSGGDQPAGQQPSPTGQQAPTGVALPVGQQSSSAGQQAPAGVALPAGQQHSPTGQQAPTGVALPVGQQPPQQRPAIRITTPSFLIPLTDSELAELISQVDKKYNNFSTASTGLKNDFQKYNSQLTTCSDKSYTYEEQQAAGCLPNDTIQQCSDKLLKICVERQALALKASSGTVQTKIQELIAKATELANRLKTLNNVVK